MLLNIHPTMSKIIDLHIKKKDSVTTEREIYAFHSMKETLDEREVYKRSNFTLPLLSCIDAVKCFHLQWETKTVNNVRLKIDAGQDNTDTLQNGQVTVSRFIFNISLLIRADKQSSDSMKEQVLKKTCTEGVHLLFQISVQNRYKQLAPLFILLHIIYSTLSPSFKGTASQVLCKSLRHIIFQQ